MLLTEIIDTLWAVTPSVKPFKKAWLFKSEEQAKRAATHGTTTFGGSDYFPVEQIGSTNNWVVFQTERPIASLLLDYSITELSAKKKLHDLQSNRFGWYNKELKLQPITLDTWKWPEALEDEA